MKRTINLAYILKEVQQPFGLMEVLALAAKEKKTGKTKFATPAELRTIQNKN